MGIFKKFFSIGSKKSKKLLVSNHDTEPLPSIPVHLNPNQEEETETAVSRLLRSSSGRFVEAPEMDFTLLPPLPHPINSVIPPPTTSTVTLGSVSGRSTYSVTVHGRTVHTCTEFPNAYPAMDNVFTPKRSLTDSARRRSKSVPITPRDKNRLLALRQDPSVVTLLSHYDNQGCLDSAIFSNTPSPLKEGRVQRRSTGSTLRQLLGHPSSPELRNSSFERDISWAEQFLGETDGTSSASSSGPLTPANAHFVHADQSLALSAECDTSAMNHPTFSSLEVELSVSTDLAHQQVLNSLHENPMTPQRASQIFGFLADKKKAPDGPPSRLPQLKTTTPHNRQPSVESVTSDTQHSNTPLRRCSGTHIPQPVSPTSQRRFSDPGGSIPPSPPAATFSQPQYQDEESSHLPVVTTNQTGQSSRGPRGPRPPSTIASRLSLGPSQITLPVPFGNNNICATTELPTAARPALGTKSNSSSKYAGIAAKPQSQIPTLRSASGSSIHSTEVKQNGDTHSVPRSTSSLHSSQAKNKAAMTDPPLPINTPTRDKENAVISRLPQPVTPVRPFGFRPPYLHDPPSPASSSELSPVAKQLMTNLRQQRTQARQRARQAGRLGSGPSRIRY
ncbi:hypothetical protein BU15DRAFT_73933 [Melanogaster broomeanus]|nr:hypothetical protein BU15DRAFT_73933 [Melanogaster broomeanus]